MSKGYKCNSAKSDQKVRLPNYCTKIKKNFKNLMSINPDMHLESIVFNCDYNIG